MVLLPVLAVVAQKYKLIQSTHTADNTRDCRVTGNCVSSRYLKHDTLHVTIYTDNEFRDLHAYRDSFTADHDTLSLNLMDTTKAVYSCIFNKKTQKMDTLSVIRTMTVLNRTDDSYDTRRNEYVLTGFTTIPAVVQSDHRPLCDCPTRPIRFELYRNDTINVISANGLKQGMWISFYDTCEKKEEKYFDQGIFISGKMFDKSGNDLHAVYQSENSTMILVPDTLIRK